MLLKAPAAVYARAALRCRSGARRPRAPLQAIRCLYSTRIETLPQSLPTKRQRQHQSRSDEKTAARMRAFWGEMASTIEAFEVDMSLQLPPGAGAEDLRAAMLAAGVDIVQIRNSGESPEVRHVEDGSAAAEKGICPRMLVTVKERVAAENGELVRCTFRKEALDAEEAGCALDGKFSILALDRYELGPLCYGTVVECLLDVSVRCGDPGREECIRRAEKEVMAEAIDRGLQPGPMIRAFLHHWIKDGSRPEETLRWRKAALALSEMPSDLVELLVTTSHAGAAPQTSGEVEAVLLSLLAEVSPANIRRTGPAIALGMLQTRTMSSAQRLELLRSLHRKSVGTDDSPVRVFLSGDAYCEVIGVSIGAGEPAAGEEAVAMWEEAFRKDLLEGKPRIQTVYTQAMKLHQKSGRVERVGELLHSLLAAGASPTEETISLVIRTCVRGLQRRRDELDDESIIAVADAAWRDAANWRVRDRLVVYTSMIELCRMARRFKEGVELVREASRLKLTDEVGLKVERVHEFKRAAMALETAHPVEVPAPERGEEDADALLSELGT